MDKIRKLRWTNGPILNNTILQNEILSVNEINYFNNYNKILNDYFDVLDLDISSSIEV